MTVRGTIGAGKPKMRYYHREYQSHESSEFQSFEEGRAISDFWGHDASTACEAAQEIMNDAGSDLCDPSVWPIEIVLMSDDGKKSVWTVEMEYNPEFYAIEKE
jgi:hypothetical protein